MKFIWASGEDDDSLIDTSVVLLCTLLDLTVGANLILAVVGQIKHQQSRHLPNQSRIILDQHFVRMLVLLVLSSFQYQIYIKVEV